MVNILTKVSINDNSGVLIAQCIKILGASKISRAKVGTTIIIVIKHTISKLKKFSKGRIFRALVVQTAFSFFRTHGCWVRFGRSSVVLVNRRNAPSTKRIYGPMLKELCIKFNFLGSLGNFIF